MSNEIILVDSDSESDIESQTPPNKRPRTDQASKFKIEPFQDVSSEEEYETAPQSNHSSDPQLSQLPQFPTEREKEHYYEELDEEIELLSVPSGRIVNGQKSEEESGESASESASEESESEESDEGSDSEFESVSINTENLPHQLILETRNYLKTQGNLKFLERYLPTAASSEDIIKLIVQLGFIPRKLPKPNNSNIWEFINVLNHAMMKVKSIRSRLTNVTSIQDVLNLIQNSNKIMVITGAGISTSLGIPDFRSSQGFYSQVQHLGLNDAQEVFDLQIFHADPSLFYSIAYMILPPEKIYSPLHSFIQLLQSKGKLLRNYTQNIDNLESYAGIDSDKLVQCHGSFASATCVSCGFQVPGETIFPEIRAKEIPMCPKCTKRRDGILAKDDDHYFPESFGVFKPDITFFGESLPKLFHDLINQDIQQCDLLISIGTSLKVAPVADIVDKLPQHIPQILINKDPIDHCNFDVSLLGYCDEVASYISNELGDSWELPHENFESIRNNLSCKLKDLDLREYEIGKSGIESELITEENTPLYEDPPSTFDDNTPPPSKSSK
ncbi:NAD-dependent protein deacetylase HST1 [Spathaspora sp. JA1]|nr:NAD-dependent protein deacetylase HST1 [Spathaspora sp. JA1]